MIYDKKEYNMKKMHVILAATIMAASIMACSKEAGQPEGATPEAIDSAETVDNGQASPEETHSEQTGDSTLAVPQVKDGVLQDGPEGKDSYFEWDVVEGADGYEISLLSKYYAEESFTEPEEIYETTDNFYVFGAQDYFDFIVKVRAYKGEGADRVYSDWSEEAAGFTYEDSDIAE